MMNIQSFSALLYILNCLFILQLVNVKLSTHAALIEDLSFTSPFEKLDANGNRLINDTWSYGGSTEVLRNFVRLTPNRQSKRGYIWSKNTIDRDEFSAILTFRISGSEEQWHGDGIGLWFTQHEKFNTGANHAGISSDYYGVGILLDTFADPDQKGDHKEISIQVNNNEKDMEDFENEPRFGCNALIRYNDRNASFSSAYSMTRLKVKIKQVQLEVLVDPFAKGEWIKCQDITLPFELNWLKYSTIGISASTSSLSDNHDIIKFESYTDYEDISLQKVDSHHIVHAVTYGYKKWLNSPSCGEMCSIAVIRKELKNFRIESEHRFASLKERVMDSLQKLQDLETSTENRLGEISYQVEKSTDLDLNAYNNVAHIQLKEKIDSHVSQIPELVAVHEWKLPFLFLLFVIVMMWYFGQRKYNRLIKSHLL